jgi:8-oxo-dGTP diphosphatase
MVLYVVAVAVVIRREGRVLAMRRAMTKDAGPGLWETLSGRVDAGETPLQAAAREVREECGLDVRFDPRPVTAYPATRLSLPMMIIIYAADYVGGEVRLSHEHDRYAWLTPDELTEVCTLGPLVAAVRSAMATGETGVG